MSAVSVPGVCSSSSDLNRTLSISIVKAVVKMVLPRSGYFNFFLKIIVQKIVSLVKHLYPRTSFSDKILETGYSWP